MNTAKPRGRTPNDKYDSTITMRKKTPGIPVPASKKLFPQKNKITTEMPTPISGNIKPRKVHNCLPPELTPIVYKKLKSNLKRKSASLVDLGSPIKIQTPKKWQSREHGDEVKLHSTLKNTVEIPAFACSRDFELAKNVCKKFLLHAWRRRRAQVQELKYENQQHVKEIDNLKLQWSLLSLKLDSEKLEVAKKTHDNGRLIQQLEKELKLSKEKTECVKRLEAEMFSSEETHNKMSTEINLLRENLVLESDKVTDLNAKFTTFQRDLEVARDNERQLLNRLVTVENQLKCKLDMVKEMEEKRSELTTQVAELMSTKNMLTKENESKQREINECYDKIKNKEGEFAVLQQSHNIQLENVENLVKEISSKTREIEKQDSAIKSLESTLNEYESEKKEFQQNMKRIKNKVIFEAIKITASLLFHKPSSMGF